MTAIAIARKPVTFRYWVLTRGKVSTSPHR